MAAAAAVGQVAVDVRFLVEDNNTVQMVALMELIHDRLYNPGQEDARQEEDMQQFAAC